jgi:hypothetical protein
VWNKAQGASLYRIQVGTDSLFATNFVDDSALVDTFRTVAGMSPLTAYYWRVEARNPVGWGAWSAEWECTTKDDIAPSVAITYPDPSATLSDSVTVTAAASDNDALHGVQFFVDGMALGPEDTTAPYEVRWTTLAVSNGKHCLKAVARDKYLNVGTSNGDSVNVYNATAVSDLWVYQDSLVPSWFSAAWSGTYDLASTNVSYSAPHSIQCATSAYGGLRLRSSAWGTVVNIDPAPYARVEFQLYTTSAGLKLAFYLENESHGTFPVIKYKNFPANQWVTVSCPMTKLNPGNLPVQFVTIQSNCPGARTFYVDDIRFVATRPGGLTPPMDYLEYDDETPSETALAPNFPNPFNPTTTISFELVEDASVSLKVYNILGQEVATLLEDRLTAGKYQSAWNPGDVAGGVYFARLDAIGVETLTHTTRVRKMLFVK